jgi:dCMP deaminase
LLAARDVKLALTIHAEANAILFAQQPLDGCTIYVWPVPPCSNCAALIVQTGISRVVTRAPGPAWIERWGASMDLARWAYDHAGVDYLELEAADGAV